MTDPLDARSSPSGLIPPRPNLGPEPWAEPPGLASALGLILLVMLILGFLAWRLRKHRKREPNRKSPAIVPSLPSDQPLTPRVRLIGISEAVRSALVEAHGPAWGSKTTEELAGENSLAELIGNEPAHRLVELFQMSDRAKFADEEPIEIDEWENWANQLLRTLSAGTHPRQPTS